MKCLFACLCLLAAPLAMAESLQVAVAANFATPLQKLVDHYRLQHPDVTIRMTVASTGKLAAQIRQGAPYDLFLAADDRRPRQLASEGLIVSESVRTYAIGQLVLWSPEIGDVLDGHSLMAGTVDPVALANPRTAPYGLAAEAVLQAFPPPKKVRQVLAENVAQSYHFAQSGAAAAAFVALSQVRDLGGRQWRVPDQMYPVIRQQSGLISTSSTARAFYDFLFSPPATAIIRQQGYRTDEVVNGSE